MVRKREPSVDEQAVKARRPQFYRYLIGLGDTDKQRAAALGVERNVVMAYRTGVALPKMSLVTDPAIAPDVRANRAELVKLLADDLAAEYGPARQAA